MSDGFDKVAPFYDSLARLVFGDSIRLCQREYLNKISPGAKVLILGGGTGWLLAELMRVNPSCNVWYLESSVKMLDRAKARCGSLSDPRIFFIHGTEKNLRQYETRFDAVITNFYFDLFTSNSLIAALGQIKKCLYPGSKLLVSEFIEVKWWQRLLLFLMYRFFRWACDIEATDLPDWQQQLENGGFAAHDTATFYRGFIRSSLYVLEEEQ